MLSQCELAVLVELPCPRSIDEIAAYTEYDRDRVCEVVEDLERAELVGVNRGDITRVRRLPTRVSSALDSLLVEAGYIDIPDLFTPSIQRVCWFLDESHTAAEIAVHLSEGEGEVAGALERLRGRCMLTETDGGAYTLQRSVRRLNDLSRALALHVHGQRAREVAPGAHVVWASPDEALIAARDGDGSGYSVERVVGNDGWEVTGLARYREHDLAFMLARPPLLHYSELSSPLSPEQLACQTIAAEPELRRAKYSLVLLAATGHDSDALERAGRYYGVPDAAEAFGEFVDSQGDVDVDWFPSWRGFLDVADQYDVDVPR